MALVTGLGLGSLGSLDVFADTIQLVEGFYRPGENASYPNGTLAWRNNNPGNLRYTQYYAKNFGAQPGEGGYAKFASYAIGRAALEHQIQLDAGRGLTILQMMNKYAPASDNNDPNSYAATIARALGVSVDTPVIQTITDGSPVPTEQPTDVDFGLGTGSLVLAGSILLAVLILSQD